MKVTEAVKNRRTIRKFRQDRVDREIVEKLLEAARFSPSGANMQPLKYIVVDEKIKVDEVFTTLKWAGYISPEGNPGEGERPVVYIVVLADSEIRAKGYELDAGAAVQSIMLTALEQRLGSCWLGSVDRDRLRQILGIPERYIINTVVALGYPGESPVTEEEEGSIRYYKDKKGILHVPKRKLADIILKDF